ncbi:4Fe-4S binding protein [Lacrimispora amygdalina]|uniref:4Fe-4S binding protein n=1 Tax=Lacrimispora amygdalina TaxID=253257 RepID=A0A3E2N7G3_9FIRM|nr:4Fe-4S dicluster domain-containing protein [Clostridium indicum]RFZ76926.1 4Fe-4S binding protein [Clostridium indicum]
MRQRVRKGLLIYSALMFPMTFFLLSPFVIVLSASQGVLNGSAMIFGLLLMFSVIGSRLFCGWLCPGGTVQDYISVANNRHWNSKFKNLAKYIIWLMWFSFIVFLWIHNWPIKANFLYFMDINIQYLIIYGIVMSIIYLFTLMTGRRGMCHSLCWMAPFMVIGETIADFLHIPRFRLKAKPDACVSCGKCSRICPMGLNIAEMVKSGRVDNTECINCLECVDGCPKKAIGFGICQKQ